MPVPAAIAGTFLVDWGFVTYLAARKGWGWMSYQWFVLRTWRKVAKTDALRELWRKQRDEKKDSDDD